MQETWKKVEGFEGYEVSSFGNVRSIDRVITQVNQAGTYTRTMKGKLMKMNVNNKGYNVTQLSRNGVRQMVLVHRLVAKAFVNNPKELPQVNHEDGNKQNNRADNLGWTNNSGNQEHAIATGLIKKARGEATRASKLTDEAVKWIRAYNQLPTADVAGKYGVTQQTILDVRNRKTWNHIQP